MPRIIDVGSASPERWLSLDIFIANIIAAFLLGLCTSLYKRNRVNQYIHMMVATGIMGGLSTFSSFVSGAVEMMNEPLSALIAICYLVISLIVGFMAVELGLRLGSRVKPAPPMTHNRFDWLSRTDFFSCCAAQQSNQERSGESGTINGSPPDWKKDYRRA